MRKAVFQDKRFVCPNCREDDELSYNTHLDMIICQPCNVHVSRADAISGKPLWVTRDKRVIPVDQMETSHIQNCLGNMLVRGGNWRAHMMVPLVEELEKRDPAYKYD